MKVDFDGRKRLEFHCEKVTLCSGILAYCELDDAL